MSIGKKLKQLVSRARATPRLPVAQYEALPALKALIGYNQYGGYCVPASTQHRPAARRILNAKVYEPDTLEFMRANCGSGDIVHAGTYFGDFLPALASAIAADNTVWAFEPNAENYRCAQITCMLNALENVKLHHAGLGAQLETLYVKTTDSDGNSLGGKSTIIEVQEADSSQLDSVDIVTVDSVVGADRHVSILQLDVEDYEQAALTGAMNTIERCKPIIILEVRKDSALLESTWFAENILNKGYVATGKLHINTIYQCT